jgi:hypothetical protein
MTHIQALLMELRWEHPGAHPHTLACLLMAQFGVETTGARVRELLRR